MGLIPLPTWKPKSSKVLLSSTAWEDLIVTENLTTHLEELNAYLADLQSIETDRSA